MILQELKNSKTSDLILGTVLSVGWITVVILNQPWTSFSYKFSPNLIDFGPIIYGILSTLSFFILIPIIGKLIISRQPWNVVISLAIAPVLGFIEYYYFFKFLIAYF